jgi:cytoskeletal protein CcmA (bactofilin family)
MMKSRRTTTGMFAAMLCLSWMVGFVTPTSVHGIARNNSGIQDHVLSSATSKVSSLGESDNVMLNELKEIVLYLTEKTDDSDVRIQSLEDKVRTQERTIKSLQSEISDASSFHRFLQTDNGDCLPTYVNTTLGPRCDFSYVTRFQNKTFFNDDAVFNENVEFDPDANCMPTYNSTTQMCSLNNNFTYDEGEIVFDYNVRFDEDVRFNDGVRFRDTVKMESNVEFNNGGEVTFNKEAKFHDNVYINNHDHDIEFKLEGKVTPRFYQEETFKIDAKTTFYKDVTLEEDLDVEGKLKVKKTVELKGDVNVYGYLWVEGTTYLDGELKANHHAVIKSGLTVASGVLDFKDGAKIKGTVEVDGDFNVDGHLTAGSVLIDNTSASNRKLQLQWEERHRPTSPPTPSPPAFEVRGDAIIAGKLTANQIRSDDINNEVNVDQIVKQVKIELENGNLIVGDVTIINNLNTAETVLTKSRMLEMMSNIELKVSTIDASSAMIGGKPYPHADSGEMTSGELVDKLKGQRLEVESVSATSVDSTSANIGGQAYPQSSSPGGFANIKEVVDELFTYNGEVTIPKLKSFHLDVSKAVKINADEVTPIPGTLTVDGDQVATSKDITKLNDLIGDLQPSAAGQQGLLMTDVLQALKGADLSVNSLDTPSLLKSGAEVGTMDDVFDMIGEALLPVDNMDTSCSCGTTEVEAIVQSMVNERYVIDMGFAKTDEIVMPECSCSANFVQGVVEEMGVSSDGGEATCTCSAGDIEEVVTSFFDEAKITDVVDIGYISGLGFLTTCPCGDFENDGF